MYPTRQHMTEAVGHACRQSGAGAAAGHREAALAFPFSNNTRLPSSSIQASPALTVAAQVVQVTAKSRHFSS